MSNQGNINRKILAKICWIPAADGGREHPPLGPRYSTVARFDKEAEKWPHEAWSVVAEFKEELDRSSGILAELRFLVKEAPSHLLEPGSKFELYEGRRVVARGEVLKDGVKPSTRKIRTRASAEMQETH